MGSTPQAASDNKSCSRSGCRTPRFPISLPTIVGLIAMYSALGLILIMGEAAPLREFAFVILIAFGAACALASFTLNAEWKSPYLVVGGPAAIFIFVSLLGAAFLHPEFVPGLLGSRGGLPSKMGKR